MPMPGKSVRKAKPRARLRVETIVKAATKLVDRKGAAALSMRTLAAELGVEAMSLYNHVASKDALLDLIAEAVLADMPNQIDTTLPWIERIRVLAKSFRQMALQHPGAFALVFTRQLRTPSAFSRLETGLSILEEAGFDGEDAVHAMRAFVAYQGGSLLREVGSSALLGATPPDFYISGTEALGAEQFPLVRTLAPALTACDHEAEYEFGLDIMIAGLQRLAWDRRKHQHP
jgi:AcrR family transcriptional regulator